MEQLLGEQIQIANLSMPSGAPAFDETLVESVSAAKTLISVVSPPFTKSPGCVESVKQFWDSAELSGKLMVEDKPRIFKVMKSPVPEDDVPADLPSAHRPTPGIRPGPRGTSGRNHATVPDRIPGSRNQRT